MGEYTKYYILKETHFAQVPIFFYASIYKKIYIQRKEGNL